MARCMSSRTALVDVFFLPDEVIPQEWKELKNIKLAPCPRRYFAKLLPTVSVFAAVDSTATCYVLQEYKSQLSHFVDVNDESAEALDWPLAMAQLTSLGINVTPAWHAPSDSQAGRAAPQTPMASLPTRSQGPNSDLTSAPTSACQAETITSASAFAMFRKVASFHGAAREAWYEKYRHIIEAALEPLALWLERVSRG